MTAKTNFKKQRKLDKKRKARAERNAQTKHRERQRKAQLPTSAKYSDEFIRDYIEKHGLSRAVADLKLRSNGEGMTNRDVMETIHQAIPQVIATHSGLEILDRLAAEGTITLEPEELAVLARFDQEAVRFTENVDAIITFIDAQQEPEAYSELIMDLTSGLSDMFLDLNEPVMAVLERHSAEVETYATEHRSEGQTLDAQMQELHVSRMERVAPLYRTAATTFDELDVEAVDEPATRDFPEQAEVAQAETLTDGTQQSV